MTYDEAIAYWFGRVNFEVRSATPRDLKLERMHALLALLGQPQDRLRIVHITGTKGKGSTAAMLTSVLQRAGYRVGLFTSPHLVHVEERIRVDGVCISREELAQGMTDVAKCVEVLDRGGYPPVTFFEMSTALGFLHFARRRVEVAVIEVGLGGRYDSTNVCHPCLSIITSVGYDHTAQLGRTLPEIAYQKAGIIKPRVPVVVGPVDADSFRVIEEVARKNHSRLISITEGYSTCYGIPKHEAGRVHPVLQVKTPKRTWPPMTLGLLGRHQAANATVALAAIECLQHLGFSLPDRAVQEGFRQVRWPARIERVAEQPVVILDTAHNVPSAEALIATLQEFVPIAGVKRVVLALSSDKDHRGIVEVLIRYFDAFYLCKYGNNPRSLAPEKIAALLEELAPSKHWAMATSAHEAWTQARADADPDDLICITGSVFLAGELQATLARNSSQ